MAPKTARIAYACAAAVCLVSLVHAAGRQPVHAGHGKNSHALQKEGKAIFRFDTFGDEQLWTDALRMHEVLPGVSPRTALSVGLKVDVEALPAAVLDALSQELVDLDDPNVTIELLRLDAVVGVKGTVDESGRLTSVGVTCALCHSTVDDSFTDGIGRRLDGWANTDLDVGTNQLTLPIVVGEGWPSVRSRIRSGDCIAITAEPDAMAPRAAIPVEVRFARGGTVRLYGQAAVETRSECNLLAAGGFFAAMLRAA